MRTPDIETDFAADGQGTELLLVSRESGGRSLFSSTEGGAWRQVLLPSPATAVATGGGRLIVASRQGAHESFDRGARWRELPLPSEGIEPASLRLVRDELWVGSGGTLTMLKNGVWQPRWRLASSVPRGRITGLLLSDSGGALIATDRRRVFRGLPGVAEAHLFSEGLPAGLPEEAGAETPTLAFVGGVCLCFAGDLYGRLFSDAGSAWRVLSPHAPRPAWAGALGGVVESQSAQWLVLPSDPDLWVGTDGFSVFASGPGRPATRIWSPPDARYTMAKKLTAARDAVLVSFRRALPELAGLRIGADRSPRTIALP
jgi:hypothetical protein